MNVEDLIAALLQVEDKTIEVEVFNAYEAKDYPTCPIREVYEDEGVFVLVEY